MKVRQQYAALAFALLMMGASGVQAAGFKDVSSTHPNYAAIMDLQTRGVIGGYPDGTFKPDQAVNRVEALKIILEAANIDVPTDAAMGLAGFSDVDASQWYAPYLRKALSLGVVEGYPDATFKPTQTVNLVENLKILINAKGINVMNLDVPSNPYTDAPKDQWYAKYVQFAKNGRLIDADASGKIYPAQGMTRGKLAEVAYRLIYINEKAIDIFPPKVEQTDTYVLSVNIKDMAYNKSSMTIGLGSTVRWTNSDSMKHDVTSDSGLELGSALLSNGDTYTHTFNKVGTYTYHCSLHPGMKGTIIVKPAIEVPTI